MAVKGGTPAERLKQEASATDDWLWETGLGQHRVRMDHVDSREVRPGIFEITRGFIIVPQEATNG
jgi:hypothetical protein